MPVPPAPLSSGDRPLLIGIGHSGRCCIAALRSRGVHDIDMVLADTQAHRLAPIKDVGRIWIPPLDPTDTPDTPNPPPPPERRASAPLR